MSDTGQRSRVRRTRDLSCSGRARDVLDYIGRTMPRKPLAYPFPVDGDFTAMLWLPHDGLSRAEADRLSRYISSLVTEQPVPVQETGR